MSLSSNYQYAPYEETEFVWKKDNSGFEILTPWVNLSVDVEEDQKDRLIKLTKNLHSSFRESNQDEINEFLKFFHEYPIAYIQPRELTKVKFSLFKKTTQSISSIPSPRNWILNLLPQGFTLKDEQLKELPMSWNWDVDKVLQLSELRTSSLQSFYDPISVYRALQRLRLITEHKFDSIGSVLEILDDLKIRDENAFFHSVTQTISQTYYITHRCLECLSPALQAYPPARKEVQEFIKKEEGHDLLILQSLKALGVSNVSQMQILPETVLSMEILKLAAQSYFLSFCCIIGAFEGSVYGERDPIATMLENSSIPTASFGLERHFLINKEGNHAAIGESFIERMEPVSKDEVVIATRLTELLTHVGNLMSSSLLKLIEYSA